MRLFDTLTRAKQDLPDVPGPVRMYFFGPTVSRRAVRGSPRESRRSTATKRCEGSMRLFDTLTRAKQDLPDVPGPVRMYFCGPTVYGRAHIGNARPFVIGMWLRRWLAARGYDTT